MEISFSTLDDYYKLLEVAAANPPPVQPAHTCEYCAQIVVKIPDFKDDCADQLRKSVDCALKNISRSLIEKGWDNACPVLRLFDKDRSFTQALRIYRNSSENTSITLRCHLLKFSLIAGEVQEGMKRIGYLYCDNDCDGLDPDWKPSRYHWNTSAITTESFDFLRIAMEQCTTSHALCKRTTGSFAPRRLIEIPKVGNSVSTRVVDTQDLGSVQWCALSYCWGGPQKERAVQADFNKLRREKRVMLNSLPRTILDAMIVAHGLGIPYMWVDSLCILQDDTEDLAQELPNMSKIYGGAVLTISASKAFTSGEGFLAPRAFRSPQDIYPARLQLEALNGPQSLLFHVESLEEQEAIDQRVWTLQESFLSTREVRFDSYGISWSCLTDHKNYEQRRKEELSLLQCRRTKPGTPMSYDNRQHVLKKFWNRKLTFHGDRLLAISAVQAVLQRYPEDRYLAGIWSSELPGALFWSVSKSHRNRRPLKYRAPSWSWASIDTTQDYFPIMSIGNNLSFPYQQLTILDAFSEPSDLRLPFGNAKRAHLSFRAPNLRLTLRRARHSHYEAELYLVQTEHDRSIIHRYNTLMSSDLLRLDAPEDDFESWQEDRGWEVYVPLAIYRSWECNYCMLLKLLCSNEGRYQRVGILLMDSSGGGLSSNTCLDLEDQLFTVV